MRQNQIEKLRETSLSFVPSLEQLERQMELLNDNSGNDREFWHLARLLHVGRLIERVGLLYSLNEQTFYQLLVDNKNLLQSPPE